MDLNFAERYEAIICEWYRYVNMYFWIEANVLIWSSPLSMEETAAVIYSPVLFANILKL